MHGHGVLHPLPVCGHSGVHPGDGGVTRGGPEADDADLTPDTGGYTALSSSDGQTGALPDLVPPPRVLLPAHQGAATVAVTRAAPRPARALHRLLEM